MQFIDWRIDTRTTNDCATTVALLTRSSRAKNDLMDNGTSYPHIHITTTPDSQISICCTVSHFRITGHFESNAPNDTKMTFTFRTLKDQRYPDIHIQLPWNPKFQPISLYRQSFLNYIASALNDPKMTLDTKRSMVTHIPI